MSQCPTFDRGKRIGLIKTMRCRCEREQFCDGSFCVHVPDVTESISVIADDPEDAAQNAVLIGLIAQNVRAAIAAVSK